MAHQPELWATRYTAGSVESQSWWGTSDRANWSLGELMDWLRFYRWLATERSSDSPGAYPLNSDEQWRNHYRPDLLLGLSNLTFHPGRLYKYKPRSVINTNISASTNHVWASPQELWRRGQHYWLLHSSWSHSFAIVSTCIIFYMHIYEWVRYVYIHIYMCNV